MFYENEIYLFKSLIYKYSTFSCIVVIRYEKSVIDHYIIR